MPLRGFVPVSVPLPSNSHCNSVDAELNGRKVYATKARSSWVFIHADIPRDSSFHRGTKENNKHQQLLGIIPGAGECQI